MTPAGLDLSVLHAALAPDHPEHEPARGIVRFLATGLAAVAMPCTVPAALAMALVRDGADPDWARERARDLLSMARLLGVDEADAIQALAHGDDDEPEVLLAAAAFRRHGVTLVVTAAEHRRGYRDCGVETVLSIAEADRQVDVLIGGGV